jgi:Flp pilus assembly protein TadG
MLPRVLPLRRLRGESGQILPLVVVLIPIFVMLLGGVVDLGQAYFMRGKLQSAADAAALAGAQMLPDEGAAQTAARQYGADAGSRNAITGAQSVATNVTLDCTNTRFCGATRNAVTVRETATVETRFLRMFGFPTLTISADSTACSPCGSKPMDVVIVADRSRSMCLDEADDLQPGCPDMQNVTSGVRAFLSVMDPAFDKVGMLVFPPMPHSDPCEVLNPNIPGYDPPSSAYAVAPLASDYSIKGALNPASRLASVLSCLPATANGGTAYSAALDAAQAQLDANGRASARDIIIFMSDGEARNAPPWAPSSYKKNPCGSAVGRANALRARGTTIYSIGYAVGSHNCVVADTTTPESPAITGLQALQAIADPGQFYNQPQPGSLNSIFLAIAADIAHGTSRLADTP